MADTRYLLKYERLSTEKRAKSTKKKKRENIRG